MDLDQYLEKMITNTKIIWIQKLVEEFIINLLLFAINLLILHLIWLNMAFKSYILLLLS